MGKYYLGTGTNQYNFQVVDSTGVIQDLNLSGLYLSITGKAADADKLDNYDSSFFRNIANLTGTYTGAISGKASDSELLDGFDSSYFLNGANITGTVQLSGTFTGYYTGAFSGTITHTDSITFHTGLGINPDPAELTWNDGIGTMQLGLQGGNVDLRVGLQNYEYVTNRNASTLSKGSVVYISGAQGNRPAVALALANADSTSAVTFGILAEDIASMADGYAITNGLLTNLNTTGFAEGAALYLSPTISGAVISSKPQAPNHSVLVGFCVRSHQSAGEILVKIQNGVELDELHDVRITSAQNNDIIRYNAPSGVWFNSNTLALNGTGSHYISGDLGIGTPSPSAKLHIFGADKRQIITSTTDNAALVLGQWDGTTNRIESSTRKLLLTSYANGISLGVNGSENVHVSTSGNLGVGTLTPAQKLTIGNGGKIAVYTAGDGRRGLFFNDGTGTWLESDSSGSDPLLLSSPGTNGSIRLYTNGTEKARLDNNGNFGIGSTGPNSKLTIGTDFASIAGITVDTVGIADSQLVLRKAASKPAFGVLTWDNEVYLSAGIYYDGGTWVHHNSNNSNQLFVMRPGTGVAWYASNNGTGSWDAGSNVILWDHSGYWKNLVQSTASGSSYFTGGNVGVGTASPSNKLDVAVSTASSTFLTDANVYAFAIKNTDTTAGNAVAMTFGHGGSTYTNFIASVRTGVGSIPTGDLVFGGRPADNTNFVERVRIVGTTGNVGIGTTSPLTKLNLSGGGGAVYQTFTDTTNAYHHGYVGKNGGGLVFGFSSQNGSFSADEKMRITTSGNVGIGTTDPTQKLYVSGGNVAIEYVTGSVTYTPSALNTSPRLTLIGQYSTTDTYNLIRYWSGGSHDWSAGTVTQSSGAADYIFQSYNGSAHGERLRITAAGNVGIGTTTPSALLTVNSAGSEVRFRMNTNGTNQIIINHDSSVGILRTESNTPLTLGTYGSERLRITAAGNVGIGLISPDSKLHIAGTHADEGADRAAATVLTLDTRTDGTGTGKTYFKTGWINTGNYGVSTIGVGYWTGSNAIRDVLTLLGNGNVGIGIASPSQKLEVTGNIKLTNGGYIYGDGANAQLHLSNALGSQLIYGNVAVRALAASVKIVATSEEISLQNNGGTIWMTAGGNVGIGTTAPEARLDVSGTIAGTNLYGQIGHSTGGKVRFWADTAGQNFISNYWVTYNNTNTRWEWNATTSVGSVRLDFPNSGVFAVNVKSSAAVTAGNPVNFVTGLSVSDTTTTVGGNLTVSGTGTSTINNLSIAPTSGHVYLTGPSAAGKFITLQNGNATGGINFRDSAGNEVGSYYQVTDAWTFSKNTTISGNLTVSGTGTSTFGGNLTVSGGTETIDATSGTASATLNLIGRSSGVAKTASIAANSAGSLVLSAEGAGSSMTIAANTGNTTIAYNLTVSGAGRNLFSGPIGISGPNPTHATSMTIIDHASPIARIIGYGPNASTAGSFSFIGLSSDGTVGGTRFSIDGSGNASFNGTVSATGNITSSTSTNATQTIQVTNSNAANSALSRLVVSNGTYEGSITVYGTGFTTNNAAHQNRMTIAAPFICHSVSGQHHWWIGTTGAGNDPTNATQVMRLTTGGQFVTQPFDYSYSAWGLEGINTSFKGRTITDSSTAVSGTVASAAMHSFGTSTLAATNTSVTTTNAATVYIVGGPSAGTNQTITNSWGLWNAGKTRLDGDVTIGGNLTVNGTTTTVNSTVTTIDDPIITLGGDTAPTTDDNKDRGIEFRWHNGSAAKVGFFGFDDSTGYFTFIPDATNTSEVFGGTQGDIQASNFRGTLIGNSSTTTKLNVTDSRNTADTPETISMGVVADFKANGTNSLSDGGSYNGVLTFRQYGSGTDWSGGRSHQLAFTDNDNIWHRSGTSTSWGTWYKIWHQNNDGAGSGLDADLLDGYNQDTANTANTIVRRDASGNFSAGVITGTRLEARNSGTTQIYIDSTNNGSKEIVFQNNGATTGYLWQASTYVGLGGGSGSNSLFVTTSNGNVGVGTTGPNYKLDVAGAISMHDEAQDIDSRFYGGSFLRGWSSFVSGSESNITYTTDSTCPGGNEILSVNSYVWARGPKIRLDRTQNYEVEMWVKRQTANTPGHFYFVVSNYDSSGNVIAGDGTDWHYPVALNPPPSTWTKYRFVVGPYGGLKDHASNASHISIGFIANLTSGNDVVYFTGFKCRPIPRYNNDALTIYNNGSVGVGTSSPNAKLQIAGTGTGILTVGTLTNDWGGVVAIGTTDGNGIILSKINAANDSNRVLTLMRDDTNGASITGYKSGGTSADIGFQIRANAKSYFNGGNVGIGTNDPSKALHIIGGFFAQSNSTFSFGGNSTSGNVPLNSFFGDVGTTRTDYTLGVGRRSFTGGIINAEDIIGGVHFFGTGSDGSTVTVGAAIEAISEGSSPWGNGGNANTSIRFLNRNNTNNTYATLSESVRITNDGKVGIGATAPTQKLEVKDGNILAGNSVNNNSITVTRTGANSSSLALQAYTDSPAINWNGAGGYFRFIYSSTEQMRLNSSGNLLIGATTALVAFGQATAKVQSGGGTDGGYAIQSFSANAFASNLDFFKSRNATVGTNTIVQNGDTIGKIYFNAADGTQYLPAASIFAEVNGVPGVDDMPGALKFAVTADGAKTPSVALTIKNDGNVGIGTTTPNYKLQVQGTAYVDSTLFVNGATTIEDTFTVKTQSGSHNVAIIDYSGVAGGRIKVLVDGVVRSQIGTYSADDTFFNAGYGGNVGIGISTPSDKLDILGTTASNAGRIMFGDGGNYTPYMKFHKWTGVGTSYYQTTIANSITAGGALEFYTGGGGAAIGSDTQSLRMIILQGGNVGINTTSPGEKLHVSGTVRIDGTTNGLRIFKDGAASITSTLYLANSGNTRAYNWQLNSSGDGLDFFTYDGSAWAYKITYLANGNVGIGTQAPSYKLEVNGSFAATTKSFVIPHPTKEGKKLRYGSLEGPENGVYIRGKTTSKVIELPDYWTKLVDPESITVQLTPIGSHQKLYVEKIEDNKVYIANENLLAKSINCFFYILAERADVEKLQVEIDA